MASKRKAVSAPMSFSRQFFLSAAIIGLTFCPIAGRAQAVPHRLTQRQKESYALALDKILTIRRAAEQNGRGLQPLDRSALQRASRAAAIKTLKRYGLTVSTFNNLTTIIEGDAALKREIREKIMRARVGF